MVRNKAYLIVIEQLLHSPPETFGSVLIHGFKHEQEAAKLEYSGANKGCDATTGRDFTRKLC